LICSGEYLDYFLRTDAATRSAASMQIRFADLMLDTDRRELCRGTEPIDVEPQVFDLLVYLVQNRDRVVSRDDLIADIWGGRIVSDSTVTSRINAARKAIGDSGREQRLIRTVSRKGIRFIVDVDAPAVPRAPEPAAARSPGHLCGRRFSSARPRMACGSRMPGSERARRW
jgi:DNA-binding winged helix-turn-helix (wHTH) protein